MTRAAVAETDQEAPHVEREAAVELWVRQLPCAERQQQHGALGVADLQAVAVGLVAVPAAALECVAQVQPGQPSPRVLAAAGGQVVAHQEEKAKTPSDCE